MNKLTQGATRLLVLALGLGLVSTAWAVKPKAVWWGDLSDGSSRGGFTIDLNNGSATENLNTAVDGVVTIGSGSNGGVRFMKSAASGYQLSVVARINPGSSADVSSSPVLFSMKNAGDNNRLGVGFSTDGKLYGLWNGNGTYKTRQAETAPSLSDSWVYVAGRFWNMPSSDTTNTHGTYGYWAGEEKIFANACRSDAVQVTGVTIGGLFGTDTTRHLNGAKFDYVVVFDDATGDVVTDINNFSVSGMTTVGTDLGAATAATGVNLPASATLNAAATPAAVFVQQNSTLTMTGSASLTVNSGTGPLYVADDTALTIDATGITSLTAQNPSVTLVSATIYGTDLITVKVPVIAGAKVVASVTESGITLSYSVDSVTFKSPFTGSDLAAPTTATAYGESATEISFGNNEKFNQTIGDRTAIVVDITGGTYEKLNGFLRTAENTAADARSKDVYLALTGGTANRVSGVQDCTTWSYAGTTTTTGDSIVQIQDGATVDFVYGAGGAGGYSGYQVVVNGSSGVSIKGGTVRGSVVGGWTSSHNLNPTVNYDTAVLVETVLGTATAATGTDIPAGYIIGGSAYNRNSSSASTVGRNSFVTLSLAGKSGAFDRTIIGGSAQVGGATSGNQAVTGNSSVTITAANDVSFANPIIGGGAKLVYGGQGSVTVGGNSSVTISGGTYTGRIVAGGYAPNGGTANVSGTATLTLNSGVFTGATLAGGNATGAKTLVVGDNLDISGATVTGFTAVTLGDGATAQMETGDEGTATLGSGAVLKLIIEDADIADGYTPSVSGSGTVEYYEYVESVLTKITDAARLDGNNLRATAPVWSPAAADASGNLADTARWSTGAIPANDTAIVKMVVNGSNTLTVNETRAFGHLYVEGSGTLLLEGDGTHHLTVGNLNIASGVTVTINDADDPLYVTDGTIDGSGTLTLANDANLTLDGVTKTSSVSLTVPSGTTLTIGGDGTTTLPLGDRVIAGNIVIEDGATLVSTTNDAPDYNHACNVYIYGTLTLNARWSMNANNKIYCYTGATINGTGDSDAALDLLNQNTTIYVNPNPDTQAAGNVTCSARIRLRGNATVNVAEGMTFLQTGSTINRSDESDCGYTKTGGGVFHIKGSYEPRGTTTVSAGKILFEDVNFNTEANPGALAGTGTVEFKGSTDHRYFYGDATGFSGKFIVTKANNSKDVIFHGTASQFSSANPPEFEVSGGVVLTGKYDNKILPVKDFSGAGNISAAFGTVSSHVNRTIDTLQTKDTAFAGTFTYANNNSYHRNAALTVRGADNAESVCALTLSGVSTTYGPLMITNNAKVVFTSAGSWRNGQVTVGKDGWLESTNATVLTSLTLTDGANIAFPTDSSKLTGITSLTFASGTTYISFADGVTPTDGTLIDWSGALLESAPAGDFQLVGSVAGDWILAKSATGLSIAAAAAKVTPTTGNPVAYASVASALSDYATLLGTDEGATMTILDGTTLTEPDVIALAQMDIYYDSSSGVLTKAVAKVGQTCYPSLSAAISDGAAITLLRDSNEAIALDVAITLTETASYSGTLSGSGTLTLAALRDAAMTFGTWTGTVVLPENADISGRYIDDYGIVGSTVRLTGATTATWLRFSNGNKSPVAPTIEIPEGASFTLASTGLSSSFAYTFNVLKGAGSFTVNISGNIDISDPNYSAYFLLKDVSNFTGSLSATGAGIAIGASKPAYTTTGGKIILTTSATIATGKTWTATGGIVLADAAATLTNTDGALSPAPTTTVANSYVKLTGSTYAVDTYKTVTFAGSNFSVAVTTNGQAVAVANNTCTVEAGEISFAVTPSSGYRVTVVSPSSGSVSGEGPYAYTVAGDATITVTTEQDSSVEIGAATFVYGVDFTNATVSVAVTEVGAAGTSYTLTVNNKSYVATASAGVVTFNNVEVPRGAAYGPVSYNITSTASATTGATSGSAAVANVIAAGWINENATTHGLASAGGAWTNAEAVTYSEGKATISDNRFVATEASTASRVVLAFEVCFSSTSEDDVSGEAQAAIKLGAVNDATTFMVLTTANAWEAVSNAELPIDASATYDVVLAIDYGTSTYKVDVEGKSLTNSAGVASFSLATSKATVQNIDFVGSGTITSIKGDQLEGYMVVDKNGHRYSTVAEAIAAYNQDNTIGPLTMLHEGTAPSGWKIATKDGVKILKKIAKGFVFLMF